MDPEDFRTIFHATVDVADAVKDPSFSPEAEKETPPEGPNVDDAHCDKMRCNILAIKMYLDEPEEDDDEESLLAFLRNLADMDVTFEALKETLIGRSVRRHCKHRSSKVRRLALDLISKWKEVVRKSLPYHSKEEPATKDKHPPPPASPVRKTSREDPRFGPKKLALARKRLRENYEAAENAKKKRRVKLILVHEIPKGRQRKSR